MTDIIEECARAISYANGDDYDAIPKSKREWTINHGQFGGRYRDINLPYQCDYEAMAMAVLRVPSLRAGLLYDKLDAIKAAEERRK